jgi:hypothetical protein
MAHPYDTRERPRAGSPGKGGVVQKTILESASNGKLQLPEKMDIKFRSAIMDSGTKVEFFIDGSIYPSALDSSEKTAGNHTTNKQRFSTKTSLDDRSKSGNSKSPYKKKSS